MAGFSVLVETKRPNRYGRCDAKKYPFAFREDAELFASELNKVKGKSADITISAD